MSKYACAAAKLRRTYEFQASDDSSPKTLELNPTTSKKRCRTTTSNRIRVPKEKKRETEAEKAALVRGRGGATCSSEEAVDLGGEERVPPAGATHHGRACCCFRG
jgi:hypothetical protein